MSREPRPLTLRHATALVVASMVGTGVFTTTGLMVASLGSPALVLALWLLAGALSLAGAAVYAELGAMMPRAGGEYVYLSRAFHPALGFMSGWVSLVVGFAAPTAASALAFGRYLHAVTPAVPVEPAALALVAATTALHARSVRRAGAAQAALTALVALVIAAFLGAALARGGLDWSRLTRGAAAGTSRPTAGAVAVSLAYVAYAYFGWNAAAYVAGEIRDPDRTLPRALVGGAALVTALYMALNAVFLAAVPPAALAGHVEVADLVARALFGARAAAVLSSLVALALAASVSALVMTGARVTQAMAEDGAFFAAMARRSAHGAPTASVLLLGALAAAGVATGAFEPILVYAGFTLTLNAAAAVAGAFALRRREPDAPRPHRALGWPASGVAYLAFAAFMTIFGARERPLESLAAVATLAVGGCAYWAWRRSRPRGGPGQDRARH